jgi:hypothetical protein
MTQSFGEHNSEKNELFGRGIQVNYKEDITIGYWG